MKVGTDSLSAQDSQILISISSDLLSYFRSCEQFRDYDGALASTRLNIFAIGKFCDLSSHIDPFYV